MRAKNNAKKCAAIFRVKIRLLEIPVMLKKLRGLVDNLEKMIK
jgi:hypothetical protein